MINSVSNIQFKGKRDTNYVEIPSHVNLPETYKEIKQFLPPSTKVKEERNGNIKFSINDKHVSDPQKAKSLVKIHKALRALGIENNIKLKTVYTENNVQKEAITNAIEILA